MSEQNRIGDDLRGRMKSVRGHFDEEGDEEDEGDDNLVVQARAILQEASDDVGHEGLANVEQESGIFKLAFMQRGLHRQRERAKEEARKLLEELERNMSDSNRDEDDSCNEEDEKTFEKKPKPNENAISAKETATILPTGKLVATHLEFGKSNAIEVNGSININIGENGGHSGAHEKDMKYEALVVKGACETSEGCTTHKFSEPGKDTDIPVSSSDARKIAQQKQKVLSGNKALSSLEGDRVESSFNPWMRPQERNKSKKRKIEDVVIDIKEAASALADSNINETACQEQKDVLLNDPMSTSENKASTVNLTQEELVRRAFAAPTDAELLEEFAKEKDALRDTHDPTRKVQDKKIVSGWGSWAGEGVPPPRPPSKLPKKYQPPPKREEPRKRRKENDLRTVIINDRRIKKNINYQIAYTPYPYRSREEYEKAMAGAIGKEWNVSGAVKTMTRPEVQTTKGRIIRPISKKAKMKRAPAKF